MLRMRGASSRSVTLCVAIALTLSLLGADPGGALVGFETADDKADRSSAGEDKPLAPAEGLPPVDAPAVTPRSVELNRPKALEAPPEGGVPGSFDASLIEIERIPKSAVESVFSAQ